MARTGCSGAGGRGRGGINRDMQIASFILACLINFYDKLSNRPDEFSLKYFRNRTKPEIGNWKMENEIGQLHVACIASAFCLLSPVKRNFLHGAGIPLQQPPQPEVARKSVLQVA